MKNMLLLKAGEHKYQYVALLSSGHLVHFSTCSRQEMGEVTLTEVTLGEDEYKTLALHSSDIVAVGERKWTPKW